MHPLTPSLWIVVVLLLLSPSRTEAQPYAQQVWDQLQAQHEIVTKQGDFILRNYILGNLDQGDKDTWSFYFDENLEYLVSAACDADCSDIDVKIKNEAGEVVVEDTLEDDQPIVSFTPSVSGTYDVEIGMYKCADEPCYFGFGIFWK